MRSEIIDKMAALVTAAFGLVAALAWNEGIGPMLIYAVVVTVIAVLVTVWVGKAAAKAKG